MANQNVNISVSVAANETLLHISWTRRMGTKDEPRIASVIIKDTDGPEVVANRLRDLARRIESRLP